MSPDADPDSGAAPYLEITPADGDLTAVETVFRQLAAEAQPLATYLVSEGATSQYIIGAQGGELGFVKRFCRRLLPDTYSLEPTTNPLDDFALADTAVATELVGSPHRRRDWQTPLTPHHATTRDDTGIHSPLGDLVDRFADTDATCLYQALIEPTEPWEHLREERTFDLKLHGDTPGQTIGSMLFGTPDDTENIHESNTARLDAIDAKDARYPIAVTARLLITGPTIDDDALTGIDGLLAPISGEYYTIRTRTTPHADPDTVQDCYHAMQAETAHENSWAQKLKRRLPLASNASPRIITDATAAPHFCLLDPESLTQTGGRVASQHREETTGRPRPDPDILQRYQTLGLTLGHPQTVDSTVDESTVAVPPALQPLHMAWFGQTGSGKTSAGQRALLDNHQATDGATIILEGKGDGMPHEYLQAHYHRYGSLDDVYYINCRNILPALSVFDIRQDLHAGIDRNTAVIDRVDHYVDILEQLIGPDRYRDAIRSTDVLRYLLRACFDPVHGQDAFSHQAYLQTITRMQTTQEPPAVSDDDLATALQGVAATHRDSFQKIMGGVKTRVEEIVTDQRLTTIFNHVPQAGDPHFQFDALLNEDCVVILDTGGLREQSQRVLTLVLLAELWAALRRRTQHTTQEPPLVNLYLEEASDIATSQILRDLLAKGRGFNVSVTLATQFPGQLQDNHGTLDEVLNNVATVVTGNVPDDQALARRLATSDHSPRTSPTNSAHSAGANG